MPPFASRIAAANERFGFSHPETDGWDHISFCQFAGPLTRERNELRGPNTVVVRPGKIDRSPTGTGCSARMAALSARGLMTEGDVYRARSILGSEFVCRIARETTMPQIRKVPIPHGGGDGELVRRALAATARPRRNDVSLRWQGREDGRP